MASVSVAAQRVRQIVDQHIGRIRPSRGLRQHGRRSMPTPVACYDRSSCSSPGEPRRTTERHRRRQTAEGLKPKSRVKYRQWLLDSFVPFAEAQCGPALQRVAPATFDLFRKEKQKTQSSKSMYTGLTIIKQFFKWCSGGGRDYLERNPLARCKVKKPYVAPKFTPTSEQVNANIEAAEGERKRQYAMAAFLGLRAQEIQMLGPLGVDKGNRWVHVVGRDNWTPKTLQARKIPIHDCLHALLPDDDEADRPYYYCASPSSRCPKGDHYINVKRLNEDLQKLAKKLGIPTGRKRNGLTLHSLRHFFETQCVDSGVPQFVVDAWMGHARESLMGRAYYGLTNAKSQGYMKQVKF